MRAALREALLPVLAIAAALLVFGLFVAIAAGADPVEAWSVLFQGAFGSWFSWQNTLQRAAPLMLTALCVAIPARAGLVIIGGEGALVLGGLACAAMAYLVPLPANIVGTAVVCLAGADPTYAEWGEAAARALRDAGARRVVIAGRATDYTDDACAMGVDALAFLTRTREALA